MSLRPRQIDFEETWQRVRVTVSNVVSVQPVSNNDWNDCFSYPLCMLCVTSLVRSIRSWGYRSS